MAFEGKIELSELNPHSYEILDDVAGNLRDLCCKLNWIRKAWGKPMIVTSGLRSEEDQQRINPSAPHSRHLTGEAADIKDDGSLREWLKANPKILVDACLWCEEGTQGWIHFQTKPPKSNNRWFWP